MKMMMKMMAMRILFARTVMVIIVLQKLISRTSIIIFKLWRGRNEGALKSLSCGSKVVLNQ